MEGAIKEGAINSLVIFQSPFIEPALKQQAVVSLATNVKIIDSVSDPSLHPFRKAPLFWEKSASFL
jgi:hypothetical protein